MAYSVSQDLVLLGNDIKASDGVTAITTTAATGAVTTAAGVTTGGDVTVASGSNLVLQGGGFITAGASGTLIKTSGGTTVATTDGSGNLICSVDLQVSGNDIMSSTGDTVMTFTSDATEMQGNFSVESSSTAGFGGINYTWPSSQTANYVLQTNGSGTLSWAADSGGLTVSRETGTSFTAAAGNFYLCDISASCTVTLPTPSAGDRIILKAGTSVSGSVIVKVLAGASAATIDGVDRSSTALDAIVAAVGAIELVACTDGAAVAWWIV